MDQDVLIVGGGHNGLVCAAYLARAGRRVTLFERRPRLGGAAVTEEVFPGFRISVCSYVVSLLRPEIIQELELRKFGLEILPLDGTFTPLDDNYLWRPEDMAHAQRDIARFSARDAAAYPRFVERMAAIAAFVKPLLAMTPPDPGALDARGLLDLLSLGKRVHGLSAADQHLLVQLMTASAADFVCERFESEPLRATLASSGIIGTNLGVRSPGTAYVLLHHYMGEIDGAYRSWGLPRRGMGSVSEAIAGSARAAGATLRTDAAVTRILVSDTGRATGVVLENGEEHRARVVLSNADVRVTFERLVGFDRVPEDFADAVRRYRFRGSSAKVNLALDGLPTFKSHPDAAAGGHAHAADAYLRGAISISPDIDYLERAYDEAKYGRFSSHPYLDIVIPSLSDDSLAPAGKHVMSCFVQYAPYALVPAAGRAREDDAESSAPRGESERRADPLAWDDEREALGDAVIGAIARYAPDIRDRVLHRQVLTPLDIERQFGLTEGNIFQGELTPDQLFSFRPAPGWARYRTPIHGLYLCGSSTHPGGGVMGAPGRNAAREVLKDLKRRR
jgi:phytoene dehydrogenase-like protein